MKRIIFAILILASTFTLTAESGKINTNTVISLVRTYNMEPGFDVISVGKFGIGLARLVAGIYVETEKDKSVPALLDGISQIAVVDYEEASESKRNSFTIKLNTLLNNVEKLITGQETGKRR